MNTLDSIVNSSAAVFTAIGSLAAVVVAALAFRTYRELSPAAQMRCRQQEHMDEMTAVILQILDLKDTFLFLVREQIHPDRYIFLGLKECASQLNRHLNRVNRLELTGVIVGQGRAHQWPLYNSFRSAVLEIASLDPNDADPGVFAKDHFLMGVIRLGDSCLDYMGDESRASKYEEKSIRIELAKAMNKLPESIRERAWNYLSEG